MPTLRCRIAIDAPRDALFALTQDYALRPLWDPVHGDAQRLDDGRVRYTTKDGLVMTVKYVSHEPPERVAMTMVEGPWYFRRFSGAWIFEPLDPAGTQVTFNYSFELRGVLAIANRYAARRLETTMNARLAGLKSYAEARRDGAG